MGLSFKDTVSALCYSIIYQCCQPTHSALAFPHNDVVRFVLRQHSYMPDFLRFPIVALTLAFDLWGIVQGGSLFHMQPHRTRWRQIQAWQSSPIGVCRDLIGFYEGLTVFSWYASMSSQLVSEEQTACLHP